MITTNAIENKNWKWLLAYVATLLLPFALIFSRAAADICCVLIGVLFLWQSYENKKWDWFNSPFIKVGLLAWLWLVFVVSPFAIVPKESFGVAVPWIRYIILFAALRYWVLVKPESLLLLGKILAVMLAFVMVDTIWQYNFGISLTGHLRLESGRLTGPMDNVKVGIFMAKLLLPTISICLFFSLRDKRHLWIFLAIILLVVGEAVILLSGERTAFVSGIIGLVSAIVLLAMAERRVRIAAPFIGIFFAAVFFFMIRTQDWVSLRVAEFQHTIFSFGESVYGKLFRAADIIGENNWLNGAGLKGFRILCEPIEYAEYPYCNVYPYCNLHPHNTYLEWFSEAGIVGLLLYSSMVVILLVTSLRYFKATSGIYRLLPAIAFGTVFINFFPLLVTQSIFSNWPAILLWYSVAVVFSSLNLCKNSIGAGKY
jgi:hypothetical protein